jgi:hypothetical protein
MGSENMWVLEDLEVLALGANADVRHSGVSDTRLRCNRSFPSITRSRSVPSSRWSYMPCYARKTGRRGVIAEYQNSSASGSDITRINRLPLLEQDDAAVLITDLAPVSQCFFVCWTISVFGLSSGTIQVQISHIVRYSSERLILCDFVH